MSNSKVCYWCGYCEFEVRVSRIGVANPTWHWRPKWTPTWTPSLPHCTSPAMISAWSRRPPVPTDQKVDWQQGGSRQINTTGHSTPLAITSVQLNGTGRPVLVHRISVRDEEVVGTHLPMQPSDVPRGISSVQSLNTERLPASPPVWASPTTRVLPAPLKYRRRYRSRFARPQLLPTRPMSYWQLEPTFPIAIVCSKHNKRP